MAVIKYGVAKRNGLFYPVVFTPLGNGCVSPQAYRQASAALRRAERWALDESRYYGDAVIQKWEHSVA